MRQSNQGQDARGTNGVRAQYRVHELSKNTRLFFPVSVACTIIGIDQWCKLLIISESESAERAGDASNWGVRRCCLNRFY